MPFTRGYLMGGELRDDLALIDRRRAVEMYSVFDGGNSQFDEGSPLNFPTMIVDPMTGEVLVGPVDNFVDASLWSFVTESAFLTALPGGEFMWMTSAAAWKDVAGDLWHYYDGAAHRVNAAAAFTDNSGPAEDIYGRVIGVMCYDIEPSGNVVYVTGCEEGYLDGDDVALPLQIWRYDTVAHTSTLIYSDAGFVNDNGFADGPDSTTLANHNHCSSPANRITVNGGGDKIVVMCSAPSEAVANNPFVPGVGRDDKIDGQPSLIYSLDGGATWARRFNWSSFNGISAEGGTMPFGDPFATANGFIDRLRFINNDRLLLSLAEGQIWCSDDIGETWDQKPFPLPGMIIWDSAAWRGDWGDFVAVQGIGPTAGLLQTVVSSDNAETWTVLDVVTNHEAFGFGVDFDPAAKLLVAAGTFASPEFFSSQATFFADPSGAAVRTVGALVPERDWFGAGVGASSGQFGTIAFAGTAEPVAHIADHAGLDHGEQAVILAGSSLTIPVYYAPNIPDEPDGWTRATGAPARSDGRWICRDTELGKFVFGFNDEHIYRGDVTDGIMACTLAPATLDAGDKANSAVFLGDSLGEAYGGCYIVVADNGIYQTWDRFDTILKIRPATGYPALPAGAHPQRISPSLPAV